MKEELLYKYFTKTLNSSETEELMLELQHNKELQEEFKELKKINSLIDFVPQAKDIYIGHKKYAQFKSKHKRTSSRILSWRHIAGYTATISITFLLTYFTNSLLSDPQTEKVAYFEFSTPAGQRAKMELPDGSTVWLNAKSTLRYPNYFSENNRIVELDGEGYFDIVHNTEQPFIVSTSKANIKVLGTSFNIFSYNNSPQFKANLIEGKIDISLPNEPNSNVILEPNQMVSIENGRLVIDKMNNSNDILWKEGVYVFDNLKLSEITDKLELYYDIEIQMQNKNIASYSFSGKFRQRDGVESVLKVLSKVKAFKFIKDNEKNEIIIY